MKDDPIWNIHRSGQPKAPDTPPAPPSPPDTRGVDYAAYCEGVAAQLAGNPAIPTASTTTHRRVLAHALGRIAVQTQSTAASNGVDILTLAKLAEVLDHMLAQPA